MNIGMYDDLALYHATSIKNKHSIEKHGLMIGQKSNWDSIYTNDAIFLATNPYVAEDYVASSDAYNGEKIIVYKIGLNHLNQSLVRYDWNNYCEYSYEINSVAYYSDIPPEYLVQIADINDISTDQNIEDFKGTEFYEHIMDTFYDKVESNKEDQV